MMSATDKDLVLEGPYGPGDVIDARYHLVRPLGRGGMGAVWVARDRVLDVHVALKLMGLRTHAVQQQTLAARLLQEARAAARLGHPAICRVLNYGTTQFGDPYIASELLDGEVLAERMQRVGRFSAIDAIRLALPIMDALASAHARGIVHRDVKPDNIFLSRGDHGRTQPKLLDFGIARVVDCGSKITLEGALLGTPDYMSPEQARGKTDADGRTDVWSMCVVLYELMTGAVPFQGENYNAVLWSVMNEEPTATTDEGAGDQALWAILQRGLDKDPDARWQSMRDLGLELAEWLYERGVLEDAVGTSLRTTWIEASFSGDRPSFASTLPPSQRAEATLPGDAAASRTGRSLTPASERRLPELASQDRAPSTDSRISLAARPRQPSRFSWSGGSSGWLLAVAASALLFGVGGTALVMSRSDSGPDADAHSAPVLERDFAAAAPPSESSPSVAGEPQTSASSPTGPAASAEPDAGGAETAVEPSSAQRTTTVPRPGARSEAAPQLPGRPAPVAPRATPESPKSPPSRGELKKIDEYSLGF